MTDNSPSSIQAKRPVIRLREYLTSPIAHSPRQAALQQTYLGWRRLSANPLAMLGLSIILILILAAIFAPFLATHSPYAQDLSIRLNPPSKEHILGTDEHR